MADENGHRAGDASFAELVCRVDLEGFVPAERSKRVFESDEGKFEFKNEITGEDLVYSFNVKELGWNGRDANLEVALSSGSLDRAPAGTLEKESKEANNQEKKKEEIKEEMVVHLDATAAQEVVEIRPYHLLVSLVSGGPSPPFFLLLPLLLLLLLTLSLLPFDFP